MASTAALCGVLRMVWDVEVLKIFIPDQVWKTVTSWLFQCALRHMAVGGGLWAAALVEPFVASIPPVLAPVSAMAVVVVAWHTSDALAVMIGARAEPHLFRIAMAVKVRR